MCVQQACPGASFCLQQTHLLVDSTVKCFSLWCRQSAQLGVLYDGGVECAWHMPSGKYCRRLCSGVASE